MVERKKATGAKLSAERRGETSWVEEDASWISLRKSREKSPEQGEMGKGGK